MAWFQLLFKPTVVTIESNVRGIQRRDDSRYPYRLEVEIYFPNDVEGAVLRLKTKSFVERVVLRARSKARLEAYLRANRVRECEDLNYLRLSGPDGIIEEIGSRTS